MVCRVGLLDGQCLRLFHAATAKPEALPLEKRLIHLDYVAMIDHVSDWDKLGVLVQKYST
jgi:hypothetical protein